MHRIGHVHPHSPVEMVADLHRRRRLRRQQYPSTSRSSSASRPCARRQTADVDTKPGIAGGDVDLGQLVFKHFASKEDLAAAAMVPALDRAVAFVDGQRE